MTNPINRLTLAAAVATFLVAIFWLGAQLAGAQHGNLLTTVATTPSVVSYQGRILSGGSPFSGTGFFKFAIVNANGSTSYWSNDGSSSAGSEPVAAVPLTVINGLFTVLLGDTTLAGMSVPMSASLFTEADRRLRIWFSASAFSYVQLTPDERIASVPFALNAETLDGMDASAFVSQSQLTVTLASAGLLSQAVADARYARISPTSEQIALLKWYTAISGTQSDFAVGAGPRGIAFDGANIWVANFNGNSVTVLRANDGAVVRTFPISPQPLGLAFDGADMWVTLYGGNTVKVIRASDGVNILTPTVGTSPYGIAFDGTNMWVTNDNSGDVSVLRASDGSLVRTVGVGSHAYGIAFDGANMWVANEGSNTVSVLRASDGGNIMTPGVGINPSGVAFDGNNIWVTNFGSGNVSVLRASDGAHIMTVTVGVNPNAVAFDGANMWVANYGSGSVSVIRANDGVLVKTVAVGSGPYAIAFDGANMWTANQNSDSVSKR